ncbi:histidine kinase [Virgisporangium aliadipatigenens]|uniref:histidine kinase n=1 Tax=Virgisporangium aliadipatigenens TaxID=741659 RepID=A0A8J4DP43_9ACTN|nr:sensor histidine kinase [Virgisporangium aliadipatigenens]GIJ45129.1 histidine kinase [Virgisporangium aliadipatigenens]
MSAFLARRARSTLDALEHLVGGLGTAILAVATLLWVLLTAALCVFGVGLLIVPATARIVHTVADRERGRISRWGEEVISPPPPPYSLRVVTDRTFHRELGWLVTHATFGFFVGLVGITLPLDVVHDGTLPLWWWAVPEFVAAPSLGWWTVTDWPGAFFVAFLGLMCAVVIMIIGPGLAWVQAWPGRALLPPSADVDLNLRVAELTATRAAALDAHAAELRRIERSLHDGAQNRLVAVTVLLGAARRALGRDPATAVEIIDRAQDAAELALAELRTVARGILPPVLADRGLAGALEGLAVSSGVPVSVDVDVAVRCPASTEATAYFVVAETLTNIAKHSGATSASVMVRRDGDTLLARITDDGKGGADEKAGSGIAGMRRRIEAHDGRLTLTSPPGGPTTLEVELPCGS